MDANAACVSWILLPYVFHVLHVSHIHIRSRLSAGSLLCERDTVECGRPAGAAGPCCSVKLLMSVLLPRSIPAPRF